MRFLAGFILFTIFLINSEKSNSTEIYTSLNQDVTKEIKITGRDL